MAVLGLHCCAWAFSSYGEQGLLFVEVHRLLIAVASRCRAWALGSQASVVVARGLSSCVVARALWSAGAVVVAQGLSCSVACGIFLDQGSNLCHLHWQADS